MSNLTDTEFYDVVEEYLRGSRTQPGPGDNPQLVSAWEMSRFLSLQAKIYEEKFPELRAQEDPVPITLLTFIRAGAIVITETKQGFFLAPREA